MFKRTGFFDVKDVLTSFRTFLCYLELYRRATLVSIFALHFNNKFEAHESNRWMRADFLALHYLGICLPTKTSLYFYLFFFKKKKKALPRTRSRARCNAMTILVCTLTLGGDHKNLRCHRQDRDRANNARWRGRQIRSHSRRRRSLRSQWHLRRGEDA